MTGRFTGYCALLRLQLLSRLADFKPGNLFRSTPKAPDSAAEAAGRKGLFSRQKGQGPSKGQLILYIFLFIYLTGFLVVTENMILNVLMDIQPPLPDLLLTMAVVMAMLCTLIMSFFFIMSSLYFGRDAAFIASMPVKSRTVLAAKLTQVWLSETAISAVFLLPSSILIYIRARDILNLDALFFLRVLLTWLSVSVLPIVIVSFLSTLLIRLSVLWKHREIVVTVSGIALMLLYFVFCFGMGNITGSADADGQAMLTAFFMNNQTRIASLSRYFPPAGWAVRGLCGDWASLALFLAVSAAAAALTVWVLGMFYRKLSLLQTETPTASRKAKGKTASYTIASPFSTCLKREIRQLLRVPAYATNSLPSAFMPVLMTGMMAFTMSRTLDQSDGSMTQLLGQLGGGIVVAILAAVLTFMAGINPALATAVTREGRGHDFLNALPVSPRIYIRAKLTLGYGMSALGCVVSAVLLMVLLPDFALHTVLALAIALLFCYTAGCITLSRDVRHPKLNWLTEQEAIKQSMGALMGMLISWGILSLLAVISYFLLNWGLSMAAYAGVILAILAAAAFFSRRMLYNAADKYYCQG